MRPASYVGCVHTLQGLIEVVADTENHIFIPSVHHAYRHMSPPGNIGSEQTERERERERGGGEREAINFHLWLAYYVHSVWNIAAQHMERGYSVHRQRKRNRCGDTHTRTLTDADTDVRAGTCVWARVEDGSNSRTMKKDKYRNSPSQREKHAKNNPWVIFVLL